MICSDDSEYLGSSPRKATGMDSELRFNFDFLVARSTNWGLRIFLFCEILGYGDMAG